MRFRDLPLRIRENSELEAGYSPITQKAVEEADAKVWADPGYGSDELLIREILGRFPLNTDIDIVAMKVCLIDVTNSTHIGMYRDKLPLEDLSRFMVNIPDFDQRLKRGDPKLVNEIAGNEGKINLFSFASKYCTYHNVYAYGRDDYSIYDSIVAQALPHYVEGLTGAAVDRWRTEYDYEAFQTCIAQLLRHHDLQFPVGRRAFDHFLWYTYRKK